MLVILASGLDLLIGDPKWITHPVEIFGSLITVLRKLTEKLSRGRHWALRLGGLLITIILIFFSGSIGWIIERLILPGSPFPQWLGKSIFVISLTSAIAAKSLRESVFNVISKLPKNSKEQNLGAARKELSYIVGRDVKGLSKKEILRAAAETASENSIDGIFGPLFWMLIGTAIWEISTKWPGPLTLAWVYKAVSTIDSMIGYRKGTLVWLGTIGARLEDLLTWLPCRIVLMTLPLVSKPWKEYSTIIKSAYKDGLLDNSPNSGMSEAIFAYCADTKMGGINKYNKKLVKKTIIAKDMPEPDEYSIKRILNISFRLELFWLLIILMASNIFSQASIGSSIGG